MYAAVAVGSDDLEADGEQQQQQCTPNSPLEQCRAPSSVASADQWIVDSKLGWRGLLTPKLPLVSDYRRLLLERNCRGMRRHPRDATLSPLDVVDPSEPDFAARAEKIFRRDGFVLVRNVLSPRQLRNLREGAREVAMAILAKDPYRIGNRGSHRYSFGSAMVTRSLMHRPEWLELIDLPGTTPVLERIFETRNFLLSGGGGDFCLPGAGYQNLHAGPCCRNGCI